MISTTTTLASGSNPSTYGSSVTLTATITPQTVGATMSGTVAFYDGSVRLGSVGVSWNSISGTGTATLEVATLLAGSHSLTAAYSGDGNYSQSTSAALDQTVNKATPSIFLTSSTSSSTYGQSVTFTATADTTLFPGVLPPSGVVTFKDGSTAVGTASFEPVQYWEAQAVLAYAGLSVGSHSMTAAYPGDSNYLGATSNTVMQSVSKGSSHTVLTSSVNPSALCQAVTLTATVTAASPASGTPTGSVGFYQSGTLVATVTLTNGVATYQPTLSQGTTGFTANYSGDSTFGTSTSNPLNQQVNAAVNWVLSAAPAAADPVQATRVSFGQASVSPVDGSLQRFVAIDANQHPAGCGCGCGCPGGGAGGNDNCRAGTSPVGLAFSTRTLNVQPVLLVTLASDFCSAVPSQIQVQLTWNGSAQGWLTFGTSGHNSGDVYALPVQVSSPVTASGIYTWQVEVKATVGTTIHDRIASGVLPLVVNTSSPYDGYGNVVGETSPGNGGQYKYDAYRYDSETGWFRPDPSTGRYYYSVLGRWPSRDPLGFQASDNNLYRYVGNSPVNALDPQGMQGMQQRPPTNPNPPLGRPLTEWEKGWLNPWPYQPYPSVYRFWWATNEDMRPPNRSSV